MFRKRRLKCLIIFIFIILVIVLVFIQKNKENWPPIKNESEYKEIVNESIIKYKEKDYEPSDFFVDYNYLGDYLNYSKTKEYEKPQIPKVRYGENYYYNPTIVAQFALTQYGKYINGNEQAYDLFIEAIEKIISMQDDTGAFTYDFKWKYYLTGETYKPGWASAMAQGQCLSALARAYYLTNNDEFLKAGNKAFEFLITPISEGGVLTTLADLDPSLKNYIIFEEYVSNPNGYTLNGYMFTLLGVYDWWQLNYELDLEGHKKYKNYFDKGINTLIKILPYYDIGGFTSYDLGHYTFDKEPHIGVKYHSVHIYLLHALYSVTNESQLKHFENIWYDYVK